jgi:hypothetical protein
MMTMSEGIVPIITIHPTKAAKAEAAMAHAVP